MAEGTILDRISMPPMSGEEALRRFDGHMQMEKVRQNEAKRSASSDVDGGGDSGGNGQSDVATGSRANGPSTGPWPSSQQTSGHAANDQNRADLAELARLPLVLRVVSVIGTLGLMIGIVLLALFIVNWLNA
ncbi:hypothetical protein [Thalassospira sp.]|uniref:hypothetical protein n=1 Tax=Thalassospira sp. TaxID=1912094 RepID=UPI003AA98FC9